MIKALLGLLAMSLFGVATAAERPRPAPGASQSAPCPEDLDPRFAGRLACFEFGAEMVPGGEAPPVAVFYAVLAPKQPQGDQTPLLLLMGGNGAGSRLLANGPEAIEALDTGRPIIIPDHRGAGRSRPGFACPEVADGEAFAETTPALRAACKASMQRAGLVFDAFGPWEAAADYAALRRALGHRQWDVYAISYGTSVFHALAHADAPGVRAAILDGTVARASAAWSEAARLEPFIELIAACRADAACARRYPDFEARLVEAVERRARSRRAPSPQEFLARIAIAMSTLERRGHIPAAVEAAARGDLRGWRDLANHERLGPPPGVDPSQVFLGVACRAELPYRGHPRFQIPASRRLPEAIATHAPTEADTWGFDAYCSEFPFSPVPLATLALDLRPEMPVLILTGEIDRPTPQHEARRAERELVSVRHLVFPGTKHVVVRRQPRCVHALARGFYGDPAAPLDTGCVEALSPIPFVIRP